MAETATIVPAPSETYVAFVANDGTLSHHLVCAYSISGGKASPVLYPAPPKGSREVEAIFNEGFRLDDMRGPTPDSIAQQLRSRAS